MNNISFENFKKIFDSRKKCINLLLENSYIQKKCCYCNSDKVIKTTKKNIYTCKTCKKNFCLFKNTIFFNASMHLVDFFYIIYLLINFDIQIPDRIAKETKRSWTTIDKALKKIKKEYLNFQEIINEAKKIIKINN